jgi:hypothetical protein
MAEISSKTMIRKVRVKVAYQTDQMSRGCQAASVHLLAGQLVSLDQGIQAVTIEYDKQKDVLLMWSKWHETGNDCTTSRCNCSPLYQEKENALPQHW